MPSPRSGPRRRSTRRGARPNPRTPRGAPPPGRRRAGAGFRAAFAIALEKGGPVPAEGGLGERRHAGPDSARVEAFLGSLRAADPMICEMVADQVRNFWNSDGDFGVGLLSDASRSWEAARDSLYGPVTDPAALRRIARALDDPNACVRRAAAKLLGDRESQGAVAVIREGLRSS